MCAYMYHVNIYYGYELIKKEHNKQVDLDNVTIKDIEKIVGDSRFSICPDDKCNTIITWYTYKLETMQQRQSRIKKLESYNKKVDIHRAEWDAKDKYMKGKK
jgi:hypothetical protein